MAELKWLNGYAGQGVDGLLALSGEYREDSLVLAFEEAIGRKAAREGMQSLSDEERIVLAVEGLEREVNNGGYSQFFVNSSREFVPLIVDALLRIGCPITAQITRNAIEAVAGGEDEERDEELERCDQLYFEAAEDLAGRLLAFLGANRQAIRL